MKRFILVLAIVLPACIQFGRAQVAEVVDSGADGAAVVRLPWTCEDGSGPSECCSNFDCFLMSDTRPGYPVCVHGSCAADCGVAECCEMNFAGGEARPCSSVDQFCNRNVCESTCQPECGDRVCDVSPTCDYILCGECAPGIVCASGQCRPDLSPTPPQ